MPGHGYAFAMYQATVDELRELRRRTDRTADEEAACFAQLHVFYSQLTASEQTSVAGDGWRSWPDTYDKLMKPRPPDA